MDELGIRVRSVPEIGSNHLWVTPISGCPPTSTTYDAHLPSDFSVAACNIDLRHVAGAWPLEARGLGSLRLHHPAPRRLTA